MLIDTPETVHPIKFESIDVENIQKPAVKTQGGSGPSAWTRMVGNEFYIETIWKKLHRSVQSVFGSYQEDL